eukprot:2245644-Lingulodinium_polyedra.AAC.1
MPYVTKGSSLGKVGREETKEIEVITKGKGQGTYFKGKKRKQSRRGVILVRSIGLDATVGCAVCHECPFVSGMSNGASEGSEVIVSSPG